MAGNETDLEGLLGPGTRREGRRARGRAFDRDQLFDSLQVAETERPKALANSVGMRIVLLPAGSFTMGASAGDPHRRSNEEPAHEVILTEPFYLAVNPVTQAEFARVMGANPAQFQPGEGGGPSHAVESVSWDDAVRFCERLSETTDEKRARRSYRLPTEAEWEYACRAGTGTPFSFGESLAPDQSRFQGAAEGPSPVGSYPANLFGIFDMHGNVWEWCADWYDENYYKSTPLRDPAGPATGKFRVLRGGSWRNGAERCRASYRNALAPYQRDSATGFRVVLVMG